MSQLCGTTPARQLANALLLFGLSAPLRAEWLADVNDGALYDSNVNRAFKDADIRADGELIFSAAGGAYWALSGDDGVTLTADARSEAYHRFTRKSVDASQARRVDVVWQVTLKRAVRVRRAPAADGRARY